MDLSEKLLLAFMSAGILFLALMAGAVYTGAAGFSEVYFLSGDGPQKQIGFYDQLLGLGAVCQIDKRDPVKISVDAYRYSEITECRFVNGFINNQWSNDSFTEYNVYQSVKRMRETGGNRSKCVPE